MGSKSNTRLWTTLAGLGVILSALALAGAAQAKTLAGVWAPFNRCPVSSVAMLEANGQNTIPVCAAMEASGGALTIGHLSTPFKETNAQFGIVVADEVFAPVSPSAGVIASAPIQVPGGLQVMCAGQHGVVGNLCELAARHVKLNTLYAQLESVDVPSDINVAGLFGTETPAVSLPTRIHLINPLLGPECAIGAAKEPIVLAPVNTAAPELGVEQFEPNGTPVESGGVLEKLYEHANQTDMTFAVPGARNCGVVAHFDHAIDHAIGLPSPSGSNSLVLEGVTLALAAFASPGEHAPDAGKDLANAWHSAVVH